ncbi:MAG: DMT family transporter [Caldilineaceae bacterium]
MQAVKNHAAAPETPVATPIETPSVAPSAAWQGWTLALFASFCFSFAPAIARGAILSGMNSTLLLVLRLWTAALLFGATIAVMDKGLLRVARQTLLVTAVAGTCNGFGMLLFFWALERVDASVSSMILSLIPLAVLSLLALRGERFTYRHFVRLGLGLGGVYLLIGPGGEVDHRGILLLVIAILCFSAHMVMLQWFLKGQDARAISFYINLAMASVVGIYWLTTAPTWQTPSLPGWLAAGGLALISTYLARLSFVAAVDRIGSGQMTLLSPLETLLTLTWSMLFLQEHFAPLQWVGAVLVLSSALLAIQRLKLARWRPRWRNWTRV